MWRWQVSGEILHSVREVAPDLQSARHFNCYIPGQACRGTGNISGGGSNSIGCTLLIPAAVISIASMVEVNSSCDCSAMEDDMYVVGPWAPIDYLDRSARYPA